MASSADAHPYPEGTVLSIFPHTPPTFAQANAQEITQEEIDLNNSGRGAESVFRFPAFQPPQLSSGRPQKQLHVVKVLQGGMVRGAQVVQCTVHQNSSYQSDQTIYVAKIYDPLHYKIELQYESDYDEVDTLTVAANRNYSAEADAYQRIEANKNTQPGECTPKFYGTWCFEVLQKISPSSDRPSQRVSAGAQKKPPKTRTVCLVLLEYIQGSTFSDLDEFRDTPSEAKLSYKCYGETYRLKVWAQLLEAEAWLWSIGINQGDLKEDNVIVTPPPIADNERKNARMKPRFVILDFGLSTLVHTNQDDERRRQLGELPRSPIDEWWHRIHMQLCEWCPAWWNYDFPRRREWLQAEFGSRSIAARYKSLEDLGDAHIVSEEDKWHSDFWILAHKPF